MSTNNPLGTIVVLTALTLERDAVLAHLQDVQEELHPRGTVYKVGKFCTVQGSWNVVVGQTGQGNPRAGIEAERAMSFFNPKYVFFIGVAGGLKDVRLGDVVAATKIYYYEMGKADDEYKPRPDFGEFAYALVQRAQAVASDGQWQKRILLRGEIPQTEGSPRAFVAPIAAGEKVVASIASSHYEFLRRNYSDAIAVEMEGFGFLRAVYANYPVQALVLRGISDLVAKKEEADSSGSQPRAARKASAFAFEVLAGMSAGSTRAPVLPDETWKRLREIATELYPIGPQDRSIWERSGGDIASLLVGSTGRATWFTSLRELKLGGGGTITVGKLLATMREDYPASSALAQLSEQVNQSGLGAL